MNLILDFFKTDLKLTNYIFSVSIKWSLEVENLRNTIQDNALLIYNVVLISAIQNCYWAELGSFWPPMQHRQFTSAKYSVYLQGTKQD